MRFLVLLICYPRGNWTEAEFRSFCVRATFDYRMRVADVGAARVDDAVVILGNRESDEEGE